MKNHVKKYLLMALMIVGTLFMFIQSNQNVVAENKNVVPAPFTEIRGNFYGLNYRYTIYESLQKELTFEGQFNELFLEAFNQSAGLNFPTIAYVNLKWGHLLK